MRVKPYEKRVELEKLKHFLSDLTVDVSFLKDTHGFILIDLLKIK